SPAEGVLRVGGGIGVVGDEDGQCRLLGEDVPEGEVGPAEVGRGVDDSAGTDDARGADSDAEQTCGGELDGLPCEVDDDLENILARTLGHGALCAHEDPTVEV